MSEGRAAPPSRRGRVAPSRRSRAVSAALIAAVALFACLDGARAQAVLHGEVELDIPSMPLAAALREYGKATGLEVFYDGSLAPGHRSTAVKGRFASIAALQALLRGTGYVPRATEIPNTVTIVSAPPIADVRASFERYQPYFATIQARVSEALCGSGETAAGGEEIRFRFRIDASGTIFGAEVLGQGGGSPPGANFADHVRGLAIGAAPPAGLPQPVTMIVYPPSTGEPAGCAESRPRRAGR